ncbi:MFS transporter small subunit [Streptomyces sp. NPDC000880]
MSASTRSRRALGAAVWLWVAVPFGYGLYELIRKATQLFTG